MLPVSLFSKLRPRRTDAVLSCLPVSPLLSSPLTLSSSSSQDYRDSSKSPPSNTHPTSNFPAFLSSPSPLHLGSDQGWVLSSVSVTPNHSHRDQCDHHQRSSGTPRHRMCHRKAGGYMSLNNYIIIKESKKKKADIV